MKSIFVGNLSLASNESTLRSAFEGYGAVEYVGISKDRITGHSRGFALVQMSEDVAGTRAMAGLNGREVDGSTLCVSEARPQVVRGLKSSGGRESR